MAAMANFAKVHYRFGIVSALFVLLMAITGITINHTDSLDLNQRYVQSEWLLDWYNIAPKSNVITFHNNNIYATQIDKRLFLSLPKQTGKEIAHIASTLKGIVAYGNLIVVATSSEILLLTKQGQLVERITSQSNQWNELMSIGLVRINDKDKISIKTTTGIFHADSELSEWKPVSVGTQTSWTTRAALPAASIKQLLQLYRGKGLTVERVLLDVHTGRILGSWGVYVMDAAAIIFIFLAITGVTIWIRRRKKLRQRLAVTTNVPENECAESA